MPRRRNRMIRFSLAEISAVDHPAQEGARMAIVKRADEDPRWEAEVTKRKFSAEQRRQLADEGKALPDGSYPIETRGDLANAIASFGRGGATPRIKAHIIRRAKALGATDSLPEDWQVSKDGNDNSGELEMTEKELQKQVADLTAELAKLKAAQTELETANTDLVAKAAAAAEEVATLKAKEKLTPEQQAFLDRVKGKDDEEKKKAEKAFLALSPADRDKLIAEKAANDEVVTIEGEEVRKSVVGEAQFKIMKASAVRITNLEKANAEEAEKRETAELSKRADDTFPKLPGTTIEKVAVLKVIGKASKEVQESFAKMMTAGEKAIEAAFGKVGHGGGKAPASGANFLKRVDEIVSRDKLARTAAMEKARKEYPEEFEAYQSQN